jgi:anti-sigma28 factor (negative regulator of flagellin synthesis)
MRKKTQSPVLAELLSHLHFADTAKQIQALEELIFSDFEINQSKIEFLKEEISADRYEINSLKIAKHLIEYSLTSKEAEVA